MVIPYRYVPVCWQKKPRGRFTPLSASCGGTLTSKELKRDPTVTSLKSAITMDVAAFVFAALGFVEQAIKAGILLRQVSSNYSTTGRAIHSIEVRLKAQKYTLELWHNIWIQKAKKVSSVDPFMEVETDVELRGIWGEEGYRAILECLAQVNVKLGQASRTLQTVDTTSLVTPSLPAAVTRKKIAEGKVASTQSQSLLSTKNTKSQSSQSLGADTLNHSPSKKKRW